MVRLLNFRPPLMAWAIARDSRASSMSPCRPVDSRVSDERDAGQLRRPTYSFGPRLWKQRQCCRRQKQRPAERGKRGAPAPRGSQALGSRSSWHSFEATGWSRGCLVCCCTILELSERIDARWTAEVEEYRVLWAKKRCGEQSRQEEEGRSGGKAVGKVERDCRRRRRTGGKCERGAQ